MGHPPKLTRMVQTVVTKMKRRSGLASLLGFVGGAPMFNWDRVLVIIAACGLVLFLGVVLLMSSALVVFSGGQGGGVAVCEFRSWGVCVGGGTNDTVLW